VTDRNINKKLGKNMIFKRITNKFSPPIHQNLNIFFKFRNSNSQILLTRCCTEKLSIKSIPAIDKKLQL
jgi:hypothetical protein